MYFNVKINWVFLLFLGGLLCTPQKAMSQDLVKKSMEVFDLAQQGYEKEEPKYLIRAIDILLEHPDIKKMNGDIPREAGTKSYFDVESLYADAHKLTPFDANKGLKKRLKKLGVRMERYRLQAMGSTDGDSKVENDNYFIVPEDEKSLIKHYGHTDVNVSIRKGSGLKLSIYDDQDHLLVKNHSAKEEKTVSFNTGQAKFIKIIIRNLATDPIDTHLIIETK